MTQNRVEEKYEMTPKTKIMCLHSLCDRSQTDDFLSFLSEEFNQLGLRSMKAAQGGLRPESVESKVKSSDGTCAGTGCETITLMTPDTSMYNIKLTLRWA